jgi:D-3-phosphoglycerate dehydrogenase / 2-oxoglutarate reductase
MANVVNNKRMFLVVPHVPVGYLDIVARRDDVRLDKLENDNPSATAKSVLAAAHAYQTSSTRDELARHYHSGAELLHHTPNLLIVSTNGAGYDTVDVKACTERGILVVNQAGGNAESVAEHVLGLLLSLCKRVVECDRALRAGTLTDRAAFTGREAHGKTIGMEVLAYDPYVDAEETRKRGARKVGLDELLRSADVVSINCPLTEETCGMIGAREYALMKPTAYFITTARGFIHDEAALEAALREQRIAGAGLDVWAKEPPPAVHPLMKFDNVIVTAHTAGVTREGRANMGRIAAEQMLDALDGKPVTRIVNPQVWPAYAKRFERAFGFAPKR